MTPADADQSEQQTRRRDMSNVTNINLYRDGTVWSYAAWAGAEFDHSDTLPDADSYEDAAEAVLAIWPTATVTRVPDVAATI
jgi:hypothetical protein